MSEAPSYADSECADVETSIKRLELLVKKLNEIQEDQFSLGIWWSEDECGTTGCAMGWATTIPEFQRLGLRRVGKMVELGPLEAYGAAIRLFGIQYETAHHLFSPNGWVDYTTKPFFGTFARRWADGYLRTLKTPFGMDRDVYASLHHQTLDGTIERIVFTIQLLREEATSRSTPLTGQETNG